MAFSSAWAGGALLGLMALASPAFSQAPAGDPLQQLPLPSQLPSPVAPEGPASRLTGTAPVPAPAQQVASVTPRRFDIAGVRAIAFEDVARNFTPLIGQSVTVARIVQAAQEAGSLYRQRGFALSFVYVPEQDLREGVVRIVAVEGWLKELRIEGDAGAAEPALRRLAEPLLAERPLRKDSFERYTQLMSQLPGLKVQASAALPSRADGASVLALKVVRESKELTLGADLREPTPRAVLTGVLNDPFAAGSQLTASTLVGDPARESLLSTSYSQFIGNDGWSVKASFSRYHGYPDPQQARGDTIERVNTNRRAELMASYPLVLNARQSLVLGLGVYGVDNIDDYRVPGSGAWMRDDARLRAALLRLNWTDQTPTRARSASLALAQGLNAAGASQERSTNIMGLAPLSASRLAFTRLSFDASQRNRHEEQWGSWFGVGGQYSPHSLPVPERISFGGARFGRGYAPGDAAGDSGLGLGAEINRSFKIEGNRWLRTLEPYVLAEAAQVFLHELRPSPRRIASLALGVRLSDAKHYSLDLAVARPLGDAAANNLQRRPRVSLLLSYQLGGGA